MTTLVDTNVLLDLYKADPVWAPWSMRELQRARSGAGLAINMVVYAELAGHPCEPADIDRFLDTLGIKVIELTRPAARLAGQAFRQYRKQGGTRSGVLPDFFIGAHAHAESWSLLTRDAGRYRSYFAGIELICPN